MLRNSLDADLPIGSEDKILALRHHMHRYPELSNREFETQKKLIELIGAEGLSYGTFHETGVYVDVLGTGLGPAVNIVIRGDIDALPIHEERPDLPFRSEIDGVMHACGHDVHASSAYGVMLAALSHRNSFSGTLRIIFQPAEEAEPLGGRSVLADGLLRGFDYAVGMHVNPEIAAGQFAVLTGPVTKSADEFCVVFHGKASHAALPELGVDAITMACAFVSAVQTLVSRESHAADANSISIGQIHGGKATNIVCDRVQIDGTLRTRSPESRSRLAVRLGEMAEHMATLHHGKAEVSLVRGEPAVINDAEMATLAAEALCARFGSEAVVDTTPLAGADDFGFYAQALPSIYFWVGCHDETKGNVTHVHTPNFGVADDVALSSAQAAWAIVRHILHNAKGRSAR